jgi:hypothetical protein
MANWHSFLGCSKGFQFRLDRRSPFQVNHPRIPVLTGEISLFLPTLPHLHGVFSGSHIFLSPHAAGVARRDTALVATSKQPTFLLKYLETYLAELGILLC